MNHDAWEKKMHSKVLEKSFIFCDAPNASLMAKMKERQTRMPALTDDYIKSKLERYEKETLPFIKFYKIDPVHKSMFKSIKTENETAELFYDEFTKLTTPPPPPFSEEIVPVIKLFKKPVQNKDCVIFINGPPGSEKRTQCKEYVKFNYLRLMKRYEF